MIRMSTSSVTRLLEARRLYGGRPYKSLPAHLRHSTLPSHLAGTEEKCRISHAITATLPYNHCEPAIRITASLPYESLHPSLQITASLPHNSLLAPSPILIAHIYPILTSY